MNTNAETYAMYCDIWDVKVEQREFLVERLWVLLTCHRHLGKSTCKSHGIDCHRGRWCDNWWNGSGSNCVVNTSWIWCGAVFVHLWIRHYHFRASTYVSLRLGYNRSQNRSNDVRLQLCGNRPGVARQTVERKSVAWQRIDSDSVTAEFNCITAQLQNSTQSQLPTLYNLDISLQCQTHTLLGCCHLKCKRLYQ